MNFENQKNLGSVSFSTNWKKKDSCIYSDEADKFRPLFEKLLHDLIRHRPTKPIDFLISTLETMKPLVPVKNPSKISERLDSIELSNAVMDKIIPLRKAIERSLSKENLFPHLSKTPKTLKEISEKKADISRVSSFILTKNAIPGFDEHGRETVNQYITLTNLGEGSFGKVQLAIDRTSDLSYAIKILKKSFLRRKRNVKPGRIIETAYDHTLYAIALMKKLRHPQVVKLYEVIDDPNVDSMYLVMEFVERGPCMLLEEGETVQPLGEDISWEYFVDIISGLKYIHLSKVVHRDIKPANLLVTKNNRLKISDFGESFMFEGDDADLFKSMGSPAFFAPEVVSSTNFGKSIDIWAVGVCLYCFLYGRVPFWAQDLPTLFEKIKHDDIFFDPEINVSPNCKDMIRRLLEKDPAKRISLEEISNHPWYDLERARKRIELPLSEETGIITENLDVTKDDIDSAVRTVSLNNFSSVVAAKSLLSSKKKIQFGLKD